MNADLLNRIRGVAVGAAIGDALGMPLEFDPARPLSALVRSMQPGRVPAGSFTDDTEMALALAESLLAHRPLDGADAAARFVAWLQTGPSDVGNQTRVVLGWLRGGMDWQAAVRRAQEQMPSSAGNGSVMRCWPAALANWKDRAQMLAESALQSQITHPSADCVKGCQFVNAMIVELLNGAAPHPAFASALDAVDLDPSLAEMLKQAPRRDRAELKNSGWVRHTLESAVWGLLTTNSFEDAVVQVVNLGNDADTAGSVVGALAGAAYGLAAIPAAWKEALHGEWPIRSGRVWRLPELIDVADRLAESS